MREPLAERLLAEVMGWSAEELARERPELQALATFKYDEYEQYSPGMRFVESLALWLRQISSPEQRRTAYEFVRKHLVFVSSAEMNHLVSMAYPDFVRPRLLRRAATRLGMSRWSIARVAATPAFAAEQRSCLFLGLSDGARVDTFRRFNRDLTHEQILMSYQFSPERADALVSSLRSDLARILSRPVPQAEASFSTVVLLDDFSGSGTSYLRQASGACEGKIARFCHGMRGVVSQDGCPVFSSDCEIIVLLYVATEQSRRHLDATLNECRFLNVTLEVVQVLGPDQNLHGRVSPEMATIIEEYYDPIVEDVHTGKGGAARLWYGFADCGLPLVLHHNTPNNSIYLLWGPEDTSHRGLFPRFSRHRVIP